MSLASQLMEGLRGWLRRHRSIAIVALVFWSLGLYMGWGKSGCRGGGTPQTPTLATQLEGPRKQPKKRVWTCPKHPHARLLKKGKCPICRMSLVLQFDTWKGSSYHTRLAISEATRRLAEIQTHKVLRRPVFLSVRMVGRVAYDQTQVKTVLSQVSGHLKHSSVVHMGSFVSRGEHLATISRERPLRDVNLYSPIAGVVTHKRAQKGRVVKANTPLYTIANLSRVWVSFEAYEHDLPKLFVHQNVIFSTLAAPGRTFLGKVLHINPALNTKTRTIRVRVRALNRKGLLKPGMLVRGTVRVSLGAQGLAKAPGQIATWSCPIHPKIIRNKRGSCPICGMTLKQNHSKEARRNSRNPIVIPSTAPMITGRRSIVYVRVPHRKKPTYEGREVSLGPRAGSFFVVLKGLNVGEDVVSHGAFQLDSELQIWARPSMMSEVPPIAKGRAASQQKGGRRSDDARGGARTNSERKSGKRNRDVVQVLARFWHSLSPLYQAYFSLQKALFQGQAKEGQVAAQRLQQSLLLHRVNLLPAARRKRWRLLQKQLVKDVKKVALSRDLPSMRRSFKGLSQRFLHLVFFLGHREKHNIFEVYCQKAFHHYGAVWLQAQDQDVKNPYLGTKGPRCGSFQRRFSAYTKSGKVR